MGFLSCGQPFLGKEVNIIVTLNKDVAFNSLSSAALCQMLKLKFQTS